LIRDRERYKDGAESLLLQSCMTYSVTNIMSSYLKAVSHYHSERPDVSAIWDDKKYGTCVCGFDAMSFGIITYLLQRWVCFESFGEEL